MQIIHKISKQDQKTFEAEYMQQPVPLTEAEIYEFEKLKDLGYNDREIYHMLRRQKDLVGVYLHQKKEN